MPKKNENMKPEMRDHYDFSKAEANPYSSRVKRQVTIRLEEPVILYFKTMAEDVGLPYQTLINMYLKDCAINHRRLVMNWKGGHKD